MRQEGASRPGRRRAATHPERVDEVLDVLPLLVEGADVRLGDPVAGVEVPVPDDLVVLLRWLAERRRTGQGVTVRAHGRSSAYLSTQQAADLLGVSRPTLVKWLDTGVLPCRRLGSHRQVRREDVLAFRASDSTRREPAPAFPTG